MDHLFTKANFGHQCTGLGCKEQATHICMEHGSFCFSCFEEQCNNCENVKIKEGYQAKNPLEKDSTSQAEDLICKICEVINKSYFNNLQHQLQRLIPVLKDKNIISLVQFCNKMKEFRLEVDKFSQSKTYCEFIFKAKPPCEKGKSISMEDHLRELEKVKKFYSQELQELISRSKNQVHLGDSAKCCKTEDLLSVQTNSEIIDAFRKSINRQADEFLNEEKNKQKEKRKKKSRVGERRRTNQISVVELQENGNAEININGPNCLIGNFCPPEPKEKIKIVCKQKSNLKKQNTTQIEVIEDQELLNKAVQNHTRRRNTILSNEAN